MGKGIIILIVAMLCFGTSACKDVSETLQEQDKLDNVGEDTDTEGSREEASEEKEVDFLFQYQDVYEYILLEDCEVVYEKDGTIVYSKYLGGIPYSDYEDFPSFQYVLYIRTPFEKFQLFPVKDFKVCEEVDTIYMVREEENFDALQKLSLGKPEGFLEVEALEDYASMEQGFLEVHGIIGDGESSPISDLYFEFAGNEGIIKEYTGRKEDHRANGLKGYASGIEKSTGKRVYIDYEWDEEKEKGIVSPCISQSYDPKKDVEAFRQCKEAYERIMSGDWSEVVLVGSMPEGKSAEGASAESIPGLGTPAAGMEYMWGMDGEEWIQADINGDGMPELISQNGNGDRTEHKKPIDLIFTWNDKKAELVYVDLIDAMEFLFLSEKGQLIYEWGISGGPKRSEYTKYHFDEKWKLAFEESLRIFYFLDENDYKEEEREYYKDQYYSTFGTYGGGLYFQHSRLKTKEEIRENGSSYQVKAWISPNQFEAEYHRITGQEFLEDNAFYWDAEFEEALTEERFFDYEVRMGEQGEKYAMIKGIREAYRADFAKGLKRLICGGWKITFPEQLGGVIVKGFDDYAFQNIPLGDCRESLEISPQIVYIGEYCFENCGLMDVTFEKEEEEGPAGVVTVGDGAFAGNPRLWGIYFNGREADLGKDVFAHCAEKVYLCYRKGTEDQASYFKGYADGDHVNAVEIPAYYSETPLVDHPEVPYVLKPDVRNFFYGENGESVDEGKFCTLEYDGEAPDYGFPEWHAPCGEFCAMADGIYDITASSELQYPGTSEVSGFDGYSYPGRRYEPGHLNSYYGREYAWAEGVDGTGIGESISITSSCSYHYQQEWYEEGNVSFTDDNSPDEFPQGQYAQSTPDIYDGYMRYTEVCVVNGYAKNQKVWEENGRVKRLSMYVEDKLFAYLELEDTIRPQYFSLPADAIKAADGVEVHFRFVIEDVYPGSKYEDTCLTGLVVEFMGRRGH